MVCIRNMSSYDMADLSDPPYPVLQLINLLGSCLMYLPTGDESGRHCPPKYAQTQRSLTKRSPAYQTMVHFVSKAN